MNWAAISYDWTQVRAFLATVETGSLTAAAARLGLTQPTLGRQVAALEQALGVTLFERVGRSLVLTEAGLDLVEHARAMAEAAGALSLAATGRAESVAGRVTVSAGDVIAAYDLPPILARLRDEAPGIDVEVVTSNAVSDLMRREADIAIRHVRPSQPDLIARLVRETTAGFYAAGRYLDRHGRPATVADLVGHAFVGFENPGRLSANLAGFGVELPPAAFRTWSNSGITVLEMMVAGLGIGIVTPEMAALHPQLEPVLPEALAIPVPVWLVTHRELHTSRRIRLVYDFLAEALI